MMRPRESTESDWALLARHLRRSRDRDGGDGNGGDGDEAFSLLVHRHIALVYSSALRQLHDAEAAEDVAQKAFILLARKAPFLDEKTVLSAWLLNATRYLVADARKIEARRRRHEQEAASMKNTIREEHPNQPDPPWQAIAPQLDDAIADLGERNRLALVLRYFDGLPLKQVAERLNISETAAKARVNRGLEQMRSFFSRRGVAISAVTLGTLLAGNAVQAAPMGLAAAAIGTSAAVAGATAASSAMSLTSKGAVAIMAWTKTKIAVASVAALALVGGTTAVVVNEFAPRAPRSTIVKNIPAGAAMSTGVDSRTRPAAPSFAGKVNGIVKGANGAALAGVEVTLAPALPRLDMLPERSAAIAQAGRAGAALDVRSGPSGGAGTTVFRPAGPPGPDAPIIIESETADPQNPGRVNRMRMVLSGGPTTRRFDPGVKVTSGADGSFSFDVAGPSTIIARNELGYAEKDAAEFANGGELVLAPYARVEGQLKRHNGSVANQTIRATRGNSMFSRDVGTTTTDSEGRFSFAQLPPGDVTIGRVSSSVNRRLSQATSLDLKAGESHGVVLGGVGRDVVGKADLPPPASPEMKTRDMADLLPVPQGEAQQQTRVLGARIEPVEIQGDGAFSIEDLAPGSYRLMIRRIQMNADNANAQILASISHEFTVEALGSKEPLNLGLIRPAK